MAEGVNTATGIVLIAGSMTFANEWYQTGKADFKVAVATLFAAAIFDGLQKVDSKAAIGLSVIVLLAAATTKFGGKSVAETLAGIMNTKQPKGNLGTKKQQTANISTRRTA